jgi:hypothetical protein
MTMPSTKPLAFPPGTLAFAFAAVLLANAPCAAAKTPAALARALSPDMLGANVDYFEYGIGPPRNTWGKYRLYVIAGCEVTVAVAEGEVESLTVDTAPPCALDLNAFLHNLAKPLPPAARITFSDFQAATGKHGRFFADCLRDCGNAYEPSVYYFWAGSHAEGFREVMLEFKQNTPAVIKAAHRWGDAMSAGYGAEWVSEGHFNCERRVQDGIAREAFNAVKPSAISVGKNLETPACPD